MQISCYAEDQMVDDLQISLQIRRMPKYIIRHSCAFWRRRGGPSRVAEYLGIVRVSGDTVDTCSSPTRPSNSKPSPEFQGARFGLTSIRPPEIATSKLISVSRDSWSGLCLRVGSQRPELVPFGSGAKARGVIPPEI